MQYFQQNFNVSMPNTVIVVENAARPLQLLVQSDGEDQPWGVNKVRWVSNLDDTAGTANCEHYSSSDLVQCWITIGFKNKGAL